MAFGKVRRRWGTGTAETDERGRYCREIWIAYGDSTETKQTAKTAVDTSGYAIPRYDEPHSEDGALRVVSIRANSLSETTWDVHVEYRTPDAGRGDPTQDDPLSALADITVGFVVSEEPISADVNGNLICNRLFEPFDPEPTEEIHDLQLSIAQYQPNFSYSLADSYEDTLNSDPFFGWPPLCVRCDGIRGERIQAKDRAYWRLSAVLTFRKPYPDGTGGWMRRFLNQGFNKRKRDDDGFPIRDATHPSGWKIERIKDANGDPVSEPVLLDAFGDVLAQGEQPIWLYYQTKRSRSFSGLNLRI